jgi:hypothetical protein
MELPGKVLWSLGLQGLNSRNRNRGGAILVVALLSGEQMNYVTLVNRSSKTLTGTWDGRSYAITPGKNAFPEIMAKKFKDQNPVMGSEDPYSLERQYLCGIEEDNDDCSPIEQSSAKTLLDVSKLPNSKVVETSAGGLYAHERAPRQETGTIPVKP